MHVDPKYRTHQPEDILIHLNYESEGTMLFYCPGCKCNHTINVPGYQGDEYVWGYNNNPASPTLRPSVLINRPDRNYCCHSFVVAGQIQFLSDCTHELAGKIVPLTPYDKAGEEEPKTEKDSQGRHSYRLNKRKQL